MEICRELPKSTDKTVSLKDAKPGDVFRYAHVSADKAFSEGDFYMVIDTQPKKAGKVKIIFLDGTMELERDDDHQIVVHPAKIRIGPAETV